VAISAKVQLARTATHEACGIVLLGRPTKHRMSDPMYEVNLAPFPDGDFRNNDCLEQFRSFAGDVVVVKRPLRQFARFHTGLLARQELNCELPDRHLADDLPTRQQLDLVVEKRVQG
jgi:hypothetical protein